MKWDRSRKNFKFGILFLLIVLAGMGFKELVTGTNPVIEKIKTTEQDAVTENAMAKNAVTEDAAKEDTATEDTITENTVTENSMTENSMTENTVIENAITEDAVAEKDFDKLPEDISSSLLQEEVVIDYLQEEAAFYALVSNDGSDETGEIFLVWTKEEKGWTRCYENDFQELKPWKIETADIDGDAVKELLIAVKKTTHYDKEIKNRMFIFNYTDNVLVKKWTGSQIAGNWRDFITGDLVSAPGTELIFLELLETGKERIKVYSWFDFGFFLLAESKEYPSVKELKITGENSIQITLTDEPEINLIMRDGKLVEAEK